MARARRYNVTDGRTVLTLEEAPEGGFVVTSPTDPALITEAETLAEAFEMARDAERVLRRGRDKINLMLRVARSA